MFRRFLPLIIFAGLFVAFGIGLSLNPREIPSGRLDLPVPAFTAPGLFEGDPTLSEADVTGKQGLKIVNFFASWCGPCRVEHPALEQLGQMPGVTLYGIAYKDRPENSRRFLADSGNPYHQIGRDQTGRLAIDWGVSGTPETFIIKDGIIRYQHIGPLHAVQMTDKVLPLIRALQAESP